MHPIKPESVTSSNTCIVVFSVEIKGVVALIECIHQV
jgi:hypothetical protein